MWCSHAPAGTCNTRVNISILASSLFDDDIIIPAQAAEVFKTGGEMRPEGLLAGWAQHCSLAGGAYVLQFEQRESGVGMDLKWPNHLLIDMRLSLPQQRARERMYVTCSFVPVNNWIHQSKCEDNDDDDGDGDDHDKRKIKLHRINPKFCKLKLCSFSWGAAALVKYSWRYSALLRSKQNRAGQK